MGIIVSLVFVIGFLGLLFNLIALLVKKIRKKDILRQKKILVYNFAIVGGAFAILAIFPPDKTVTAPENKSTASSSSTTASSSSTTNVESNSVSELDVKSSSDIEEENFQKGTLADSIKNELAELDLDKDDMNEILFAHNTFVPDTAQSYQINPYLGIDGLFDTDMSDFDSAWSQVHIYGFIRFSYIGNDWLFAKSIEIKTDNNKYTIDPAYSDWDRDNSAYEMWEWYDAPLNESTVSMYNDMAESSQTLIRINGKTYYDDRYLTSEEISALKQILSIYNNYLELQSLI